jgi:hypothetical protein
MACALVELNVEGYWMENQFLNAPYKLATRSAIIDGMNDSPMAVRKLLVGLMAIGCLITAVVTVSVSGWTNPIVSVAIRMGLMLGALWLALPNHGDNIVWQKALPVVLAIFAVLAFAKKGGGRVMLYAVPAAIVVGIALVFIRPRPKRPPPGRR